MINETKAKVAILNLRKAIKSVEACGTSFEAWIVYEIGLHIEELQNEIRGD